MLKKLSEMISDKRYHRHLTRALSQVNRYLNHVDRMKAEFERLCSNLGNQRHVITDEQVREESARFVEAWEYLEANDMFAVNRDLQQIYEVEREALIELEGYEQSHAIFEFLRGSFKAGSLEDLAKEVNGTIVKYESDIETFCDELRQLKSHYIAPSDLAGFQGKFRHVYEFFSEAEGVGESVRDFIRTYKGINSNIGEWNEQFIERSLKEHREFFNDVDGRSLDHQQRLAVLTDADSTLVVAGAGSGKTLTIAGKVKFLVEVEHVDAKDILLISFTNDAACEMGQRINQRLNVDVDVFTFHKLGLAIIADAAQKKPNIASDMIPFLDQYMKDTVYRDKTQLQKLLEFFSCYVNIPKDVSEFPSLGDYHEHTKTVDFETVRGKVSKRFFTKVQSKRLGKDLRTVAGESVKSLEEVMIANFLFLHGVEYEYERSYKHDTRDDKHTQYRPDFYLPQFDVYIEHFGVNANMRAPWLSRIEEEKYIEGIKWKRDLHRTNKTVLIESFSHYNQQGELLEHLERNLLANGVVFKDVDYEEVFTAVFDQTNNRYLGEFMKLVGTFISLFKSTGYTGGKFSDLLELNRNSGKNRLLKKRGELFLEFTRAIYEEYEASLRGQQAIDFNDMINQAAEIVESGATELSYKYIIIDEYQDISQGRFRLVKTIQDTTGAKVMCVGDDWQSIFRFAGSDVDLFTGFGNFFGEHEVLRIEKTYRNSQQLIDTAGAFVMKNPRQYRKDLKSEKHLKVPVRIIGYEKNIIDAAEFAIGTIVSEFGPGAEIMLIGRNNFDIRALDKSPKFQQRYNRIASRHEIRHEDYPDLRLFFLTAHRSKGREADNVIILNAANSRLGFPNKIADDPVLSWVLTSADDYEFAEERRLFYVALTRTRNSTYILAPDTRMSPFVKELIREQKVPYELTAKSNSVDQNPFCPKCTSGRLVVRTGRDGRFLGCTNFPMCDETLKDVRILLDPIRCPECGGYMVKRRGRFGPFYGCTNYPRCEHKYNIERSEKRRSH